jgi:xylulokinase
MWLKEEMPEVYRKTAKLIGWHEYVMWKLCGRPVIDPSLAQATGVFNRRKHEWSIEILDTLGIDVDLMPEIEVAGTVVGEVSSEVAKETGLATGTTVVTGAHDTPDCSALGAGMVYEGLAMDLTGTFETVQVCTSRDLGDLTRTLCWGIKNTPNIYISGVSGVWSSGSLFKWYKDTFSQEELTEAQRTDKDVYDLLTAKAAQAPPGSNNLLVIPDFTGRSTKGAIVGLTLGHTKNDVIRALLEGITYQVRLGLENAGERAARIKEIRAIGGGAKSTFWVQLKADMYKKRIVIPAVLEGGSLGAAILAGIGIGIYSDAFDGVNRTYRQKAVYMPNERVATVYDKYFAVYKRLRLAMEPIFNELIAI